MLGVREYMGLTKVVLMVPFVRSVAEAEQAVDPTAELGPPPASSPHGDRTDRSPAGPSHHPEPWELGDA